MCAHYCMHAYNNTGWYKYVYVCRNFFLLTTVQSIDNNDDLNASLANTTSNDDTAQLPTSHQTDKTVEEAASSSLAVNEQMDTKHSTDNSRNDDDNV